MTSQNSKLRCAWVSNEQIYIDYHDREWGVPIYDEQLLFEFLILEGMQAGLSWITILKKRENYRLALDGFDVEKIVKYKKPKIEKLTLNDGIIRNKLKIQSIVTNARAFLELKNEVGDFSDYIWHFVDGKPIKNCWKSHLQVPATTVVSDQLSKDLKKRGFKFVGSTICYAFMQAVGMVNDHVMNCFRHKEINFDK